MSSDSEAANPKLADSSVVGQQRTVEADRAELAAALARLSPDALADILAQVRAAGKADENR
jgi:hypothetical protein